MARSGASVMGVSSNHEGSSGPRGKSDAIEGGSWPRRTSDEIENRRVVYPSEDSLVGLEMEGPGEADATGCRKWEFGGRNREPRREFREAFFGDPGDPGEVGRLLEPPMLLTISDDAIGQDFPNAGERPASFTLASLRSTLSDSVAAPASSEPDWRSLW